MGYANGRIPATALTNVGSGTVLLTPAANAAKGLILLGAVFGWDIRPAAGLGSGYRDLNCQVLFYNAAHGNRIDAQKVGLSTASTVSVAAPGYSSHGDGRKIDLVFNGSDHPSAQQLALANRFGFTRQFGADDPNHFEHDGRTATSGPSTADWYRIKAHYYNTRHLGQSTTTVNDGIVDKAVFQHYTWLAQAAGNHDGLYPVPPYKHDGIWGPRTDWCDRHYQSALWNSVG